jgi:hypothetical protein
MTTMNVLDSAGATVAVEKPLAPGSAADAASRPVAWSTEGKAQIGSLTETAPATDTASSGLNGRLQRVAQRLSSLIALLPTALGAGGGLKVDGSGTALPVSGSGNFAGTNAASSQADGHSVTFGAKADAAATNTDTTAVSAMSVWKQISKTLQAAAGAVGTAFFSKITDGTNTAAVKAASTAPVATDPALVVSLSPNSAGVIQSSTGSRVVAAASTNATNLKASAGSIAEVDLYNVAAYTVFVKFYNKASSPTVGTDTPVWTVPIAAGGGYSKSFVRGKAFSTGISYAITKLQADSDTTAVAAGDVTGSLEYV